MAEYDHLLRMRGTVHRYLEGLHSRFSKLSAQELAKKALPNMDERCLIIDYIRFHCDSEFFRLYEHELSKLEASAQSQLSRTDKLLLKSSKGRAKILAAQLGLGGPEDYDTHR